MSKGHPSFLELLKGYEKYVINILGECVLTTIEDDFLNQESVLKELDSYVVENFSPKIKFDTMLMERYMYLILQSYQANQVMDNLVDEMEELRESIKVSKFWIRYVLDPPLFSIEFYLERYQSFKRKNT